MTSLWLDGVAAPPDDVLPDPTEVVDVAVVGAGLTGLTTRSEEHTSELQSH